MRGHEGFVLLKNVTAVTSSPVELLGGLYQFDVIATGAGSVTLQRVGPDGATQVTAMTAITTSGGAQAYLPPGTYQAVTTGLTAVYATLVRIPTE